MKITLVAAGPKYFPELKRDHNKDKPAEAGSDEIKAVVSHPLKQVARTGRLKPALNQKKRTTPPTVYRKTPERR